MGAESIEDEAWAYARALLTTAMDADVHPESVVEQFTAAASWALKPLVGTEAPTVGGKEAAARLSALLVGLLAVAGTSLALAANNDRTAPDLQDVGIRRALLLEQILRITDEVTGG